MKFEIKKEEGAANKSKRYRFELSFGGLIGLGAVLVVGMVWVFIFGVLVGRGYQPEEQVPELATLMPASETETAQLARQQQKEEDSKVIPPEELDYYSNLKEVGQAGKGAAGHAASASAEKKNVAAPKKEPAKSGAAVAQAKNKKPETDLKTIVPASPVATVTMAATKSVTPKKNEAKPVVVQKPSPVKKESEAKTAKTRPGLDAPVQTDKKLAAEDQDTQVYDYIYQIASLSDPIAAKRFRDKVSKLGFKVEVNVIRTDSKIWHRVVVHFQGVPEDTREMKKKLQKVGVDKPLMKSKKPL